MCVSVQHGKTCCLKKKRNACLFKRGPKFDDSHANFGPPSSIQQFLGKKSGYDMVGFTWNFNFLLESQIYVIGIFIVTRDLVDVAPLTCSFECGLHLFPMPLRFVWRTFGNRSPQLWPNVVRT